jgi:hypothetical protein
MMGCDSESVNQALSDTAWSSELRVFQYPGRLRWCMTASTLTPPGKRRYTTLKGKRRQR